MKKSNIIIGILLLAVLSLSAYIYFNTSKKPNVVVSPTKKSEIITEAKLLAKKVDRKGIEHTIVEETNNVLPAGLIDEDATFTNEFVDSLLSETDIQRKQIIALTRVNQTIEAKNLEAVEIIGQLNEKSYEYKDANLSLSFKHDTLSNKSHFGYVFNQNLDIREYNKRKWILGKEHKMMDISSNTKFSTINGVNKLTFEKKEDNFDITATSKALFLPKSGGYAVGGQLKIRYKNLSATGSNLYFPAKNKFVPVVGLEYRLLKF
jgi:hypothetical protein